MTIQSRAAVASGQVRSWAAWFRFISQCPDIMGGRFEVGNSAITSRYR
ncbi:hypothetical protein [Streptomyces sp. NPDC001508]